MKTLASIQDRGGSHEDLVAVNRARDEALRELNANGRQ